MKKLSLLLGLMVFIFAGCSDFLDVNENPNYPKKVDDYLVLTASQASIAGVFSADYGLIGSFWSQHWAQNNTSSQYKTFETYTLSSNDGRVNNSYLELFRDGLADNEIILQQAKTEQNWGLYLMCATMKAYTYQYLVDLYGNVPYDEAFKGETESLFNPAINKGQDIYEKIYTLLDEALEKDLSTFVAATYEDQDIIFGADLDLWVEFANTIKLRIALRQFAANQTWATTEINKLLDNGVFLSADAQYAKFEDKDSKSNPLFEADQRQLNTSNNIRANATFTSYLTANADPRASYLFTRVNGNIHGMITGSYEVPSTKWEAPDIIAKPKLTATMPVNLTTLAETFFLIAEAYVRIGDPASAENYYIEGVTASFDRMGGLDATDLLAGAYAFPSSGSNDEMIEAIIMQKWVDCADGQRGIESHIEQVRTGYPKVSALSGTAAIIEGYEIDLPASYVPGTLLYSKKGATSVNVFPKRLPYADCEINYNSKAAEYKSLSDLDVIVSKVWWNK